MNSAEAANRQATLLCTVSSSLLVFSSLFIAGVLALIGSDQFEKFGLLKVSGASAALGFGFVAGLCAITSMMYAHNMARRAERKEGGDARVTEVQIKRARTISVSLALGSMTTAIVATLCMSLVIGIIAKDRFSKPQVQPLDPKPVSIQIGNSAAPLSVTTENTTITITNPQARCRVEIKSSDAMVVISAATVCGITDTPKAPYQTTKNPRKARSQENDTDK